MEMRYKITVIKYENNENYESELATYKEEQKRDTYGFTRPYDKPELWAEPKPEKASRSLEVVLTEEEYDKVKAEVIKVFK